MFDPSKQRLADTGIEEVRQQQEEAMAPLHAPHSFCIRSFEANPRLVPLLRAAAPPPGDATAAAAAAAGTDSASTAAAGAGGGG